MARTPAVLTVALLAVAALAGCMGGAADPALDGASVNATDDLALLPNATANATSPADMTGGHAPHIHNYWGESDRVTLFQDAVDVRVLSPATFFAVFVDKRPSLGGTFWELPDGATVYEGTGQIEFTASWTDPTITGLAMRYKSPDMKSGFLEWSDYIDLQSGAPVTLQVTPAMTDMPHEAKSRWMFEFVAGGPGVAQGAFDLKVDVIRMRDVMAFPGHPDTYEDTAFYVLGDEDFEAKGQGSLQEFAGFLTGTFSSGDTWYPPNAVPMETRALLLEVTLLDAGPTSPVAKQTGLSVMYTSADSRRDVSAQLLNATESTFVFGIPVTDAMVDTPYREDSAWHFHIRPEQQIAVFDGTCDGCDAFDMKLHLKLTSYAEDPTGGQIEPRDDE